MIDLTTLSERERDVIKQLQAEQIALWIKASAERNWSPDVIKAVGDIIVGPVGMSAILPDQTATDGQHRHNSNRFGRNR